MCFDLEDFSEICTALFTLMFKIVNDEHSGKVKNFIIEVLSPLITESDYVSNELLDIILINIVEPIKSQRKYAHNLAKDLVNKTSDALEPYIQQFFNQVLILGKADDKMNIKNKVYELIYELNHICPSILLAVLPQLEFKLKSTEEQERMGSVTLLARMFSEKAGRIFRFSTFTMLISTYILISIENNWPHSCFTCGMNFILYFVYETQEQDLDEI